MVVCGGTLVEVVVTQSATTVERNGMEIIGLSGFAHCGKSTAAHVLAEEFGFVKVSFADKLRDFLYNANPIVHYDVAGKQYIYLRDVIDEWGWQGYKETIFADEIRKAIQQTGTEAGRGVLGESVWVDATLSSFGANEKVVVDDARFFNEFYAIRERGGHIWRIDREGVGPANGHASELEALDYPHFSIFLKNNGTLDEWRELVRREYSKGRYREW